MFFANAARKSRKPRRSYAKPRKSGKGKGSLRTAISKTGVKWQKTASGQWVKVGGSGRKGKAPAKRRSYGRKRPSRPAAAPKRRRSYGRKKTAGKRSWPKRGSRKMGRAVAGVEARVHEDLQKAHKLVQSARYRTKATAKRAGGRSGSDKVLADVARLLDGLLSRI